MKKSFDEIYMQLAEDIAQRSHCVKAKVGAVLTKDSRIISIGYNGAPSKTYNCDEVWPETGCSKDRKGSCSFGLHAEQNAILYAAKNNVSLDGTTLYVTLAPCIDCAKVIFSMGIKKVIYLNSYAAYKKIPTEEGVDFLKHFGIEVLHYADLQS